MRVRFEKSFTKPPKSNFKKNCPTMNAGQANNYAIFEKDAEFFVEVGIEYFSG